MRQIGFKKNIKTYHVDTNIQKKIHFFFGGSILLSVSKRRDDQADISNADISNVDMISVS